MTSIFWYRQLGTCSGTGSGRCDIIWWKSAKVKDLSCNQDAKNLDEYKSKSSFECEKMVSSKHLPGCGISWHETSMGGDLSHKVSGKSKFLKRSCLYCPFKNIIVHRLKTGVIFSVLQVSDDRLFSVQVKPWILIWSPRTAPA